VQVLTGSTISRRYWSDLKRKLVSEGSQLYDKIVQLKFQALDGKFYLSDAADTETMLHIIQSIPSPNAEPFKLWLAKVGYERIEENHDPELTINRALKTYLRKGYSKNWINQRLKSIEIRKAPTDEWENRGVKSTTEFAILTDDITLAWSGMKAAIIRRHTRCVFLLHLRNYDFYNISLWVLRHYGLLFPGDLKKNKRWYNNPI